MRSSIFSRPDDYPEASDPQLTQILQVGGDGVGVWAALQLGVLMNE